MDQVQLEFFRTDPVPCLIHIRVPLKENRLTSRETTILKSFCTGYHSTGRFPVILCKMALVKNAGRCITLSADLMLGVNFFIYGCH
jgi:hypothetical protein